MTTQTVKWYKNTIVQTAALTIMILCKNFIDSIGGCITEHQFLTNL